MGDGGLKEKFQGIANQLPITFTGQVSHYLIPRILSKADVFILPSLWEGMPTTILEAMAAKVPVIATNVGGVNEVVKNEKTGIIINPADPEYCQSSNRTQE
ncbi:MAG: glycosyltransferase family 4 protein [Candidatus Lokiarchaeia archaeon]